MPSTGRLYVFEGANACGKTTLAHKSVDLLKSSGLNAEYFAFPGQAVGTLGKHVWEIHKDYVSKGIKSIHPASLQLMHIAAHVDAIETRILPALKAKKVVVLDRYWWSTWVYGIAGGVSPTSLRTMIDVEVFHWNGVVPDCVFLLHRRQPLDPDIAPNWLDVVEHYSSLGVQEQGKYPVRSIANEGSVEEALEQIRQDLKITEE